MCGIAGIFHLDGRTTDDGLALHAMCESLIHRGPDGQGFLVDGPVRLTMRRLSIIDVDGGDQPISNESGTIHVILNGEIYNYVELRNALECCGHRFRTRSDTETIVHAYEQWGDDFVDRSVSHDLAHDAFGGVAQGGIGVTYFEQIVVRLFDSILNDPLDERGIEVAGHH